MSQRICSVEGCERAHYGKGYCQLHYTRARKGVPLDAPLRPQYGPTCAVDGCERPHLSRGYCRTHHWRWENWGSPDADRPIKEYGTPKPPCSVDGCDEVARARGMCARHYANATNYGDPIPLKEKPLGYRLERVGWDVTDGGCWEWRGKRNDWGYGLYNGKRVHRLMYEIHAGKIPEGLLIRHRCDNPPCCNPDHLEPGTHEQNMQDMVDRGRCKDAGRTHCANGHDLRIPGAVKRMKAYGSRAASNACVECARARSRRYMNKKRRA